MTLRKDQTPTSWESPEDLTKFLLCFVSDRPLLRRYVLSAAERYAQTYAVLNGERASSVLDLGSKEGILLPLLKKITGADRLAFSDGFDAPLTTTRFQHSRTSESFDATRFGINLEEQPLPFPDESFDLVTCLEVLEHLTRDPLHLLLEIARVLRREGKLLLSTPNVASIVSIHRVLQGKSPLHFVPYRLDSTYERHNREYTFDEVQQLITIAGFRIATARTDFRQLPFKVRSAARAYRALGVVRQPLAALGQTSYITAVKERVPVLDSAAKRYPPPFYFVETEAWLRETGLSAYLS